MDHPNPDQNSPFDHAEPRNETGYQLPGPMGSTPIAADPTANHYDGAAYGISPGITGSQYDQYPLGPLETAAHVAYPHPLLGDGYTSSSLVVTQSPWPGAGAQPTWAGGNSGDYHSSIGSGDGVLYDYEVDYFQAGDMAASLPCSAAIASSTSSTVWAAT